MAKVLAADVDVELEEVVVFVLVVGAEAAVLEDGDGILAALFVRDGVLFEILYDLLG